MGRGTSTHRIILIAAGALLVAGCTVTNPTTPEVTAAAIGAAPTNYVDQIIADVKTSYFDPYSIRSAERTAPFPTEHVTAGHYWVVCVRANARNRMGGYVGIKTEAYGFRNGVFVEKSGHPETYCQGRQFIPFPELEAIS